MQRIFSWEENIPSAKIFLALYGALRFITVFTRSCHQSLFRARWIQSRPVYFIYIHFQIFSNERLSEVVCSLQVFCPEIRMHFSHPTFASFKCVNTNVTWRTECFNNLCQMLAPLHQLGFCLLSRRRWSYPSHTRTKPWDYHSFSFRGSASSELRGITISGALTKN